MPLEPMVAASAPVGAQTPQAGLLRDGYLALQGKDYVKAETLLDQARKMDPDDNYVLLNLAAVYQVTGRKDAAIVNYQKIIGDDKAAKELVVVEGDELTMKKFSGQPVADLAKYNLALIERIDGHALREGYQALQVKDYVKAEALLNQARGQAPGDEFVLLNLAVVYQLTDRKPQAAQLFEQIIAGSEKPSSQPRALALARRNLALIDKAAR